MLDLVISSNMSSSRASRLKRMPKLQATAPESARTELGASSAGGKKPDRSKLPKLQG